MYRYDAQQNWSHISGQQQSPINITTHHRQLIATRPTFTTYQLTKIQNLGFKLSLSGHGQATLQQRPGQWQELHFHYPSEHHFDDQAAALEAHFVHQFKNGQKAVVGVLFQLGAPNPVLQQILTQVPPQAQSQTTAITVTDWLTNTAYYHYMGSLTTPPIIEGIEWYLAQQLQTISPQQLTQFQQFFAKNNRDIQPLNDRAIFKLD